MSVEDAKQHPGSLVPNWGAAFSALDRLSLDRITREKKNPASIKSQLF